MNSFHLPHSLRRISALLLFLSIGIGPALAQTDTPTSTPTNTPTTVVNAATPLATTTPVQGSTRLFSGSSTFQGPIRVPSDVLLLPDAHGGNGTARNELVGRIRCKLKSLGTGTNGTTETVLLLDDTPTGEATAIDADTVLTADTTYFKVGTTSLKTAFASTSTDGDGAVIEITNDDWTSDTSIGLWLRSSEPLASGDLRIYLDDTNADASYLLPGIPGDSWTWVEVNISALASEVGNVVDKVRIEETTQGAASHAAFDLYADAFYKWKSTDEAAFGVDLVPDSGPSVQNLASSAVTDLAEYTGFFVAYRQGNDSLVYITDQSSKDINSFVCYQ